MTHCTRLITGASCFLTLLLACTDYLKAQPQSDTLIAHSLLDSAKKMLEQQDFDAALGKADSAAMMYITIYGGQHNSTANAKEISAKSLYQLGMYAEAIQLAEEVIAIRRAVLGETHLHTGFAYNLLGMMYDRSGQVHKGLEFKLHGLEILEKNIDGVNPDILKAYLNIGGAYYNLGEYQTALSWLERGLDMSQAYFNDEDNEVTGNLMMNLGIVLESLGRFEKGRDMKKGALEMRLRMYGENHPDVAIAYMNNGGSLHLMGDIPGSIAFTEKALEIYRKFVGENHPVLANFYNNLGAAYSDMKEFDKSVAWLERSLDLQLSTSAEDTPEVARAYNNLAIASEELGRHESALVYFKKAIKIYERLFGKEHQLTVETRANMGVTLQSLGKLEEAINTYREAIPALKKILGDDHFYLAYSYNGLGNALISKKEIAKAALTFDTALLIKRKALGDFHQEVVFSIVNAGNAHIANKQLETAKKLFGEGFYILDSIVDVLPKESYYYLKSELSGGMAKVYFEMYMTYNDLSLLSKSKDNYLSAVESIQRQKFATISVNADKILTSRMNFVAENAISAHLIGGTDKERCFFYSELAKGISLLEAMQETKAQHIYEIPDSLLEQETGLKKRIAFLESVVSGNNGQSVEIDALRDYKNQLLKAWEDFTLFKSNLEKSNPKYYFAKYQLPYLPVNYIQDSLLQNNQALLEYFVGDSSIFVFVVKPDDYQVVEVKKDFPLEAWVDTLRHHIYQNQSTYSDSYVQAATDLYDKLVRPVAGLLPERLIVIPDGVLGYVPFDALLTGRPKDLKRPDRYDYLLKKHQISYCYSATLLQKMRERKHRHAPSKEFVAFSPYYTGSVQELEYLQPFQFSPDSLYAGLRSWTPTIADELQASAAEVKTITKEIGGDAFYGSEATEARFDSIAGQYRIVHLATHGIADNRVGDYSFLAFYILPDSTENELLYVRDLYNLELNADMVVLSACETGLGELQRGEGIISLARAFAYAGAKSIVNTLWKVNDQSTSELMVLFYGYLKEGKGKDEALRLAKLAYIKQHRKRAMPFFWAGVIPVGDMGAVWDK